MIESPQLKYESIEDTYAIEQMQQEATVYTHKSRHLTESKLLATCVLGSQSQETNDNDDESFPNSSDNTNQVNLILNSPEVHKRKRRRSHRASYGIPDYNQNAVGHFDGTQSCFELTLKGRTIPILEPNICNASNYCLVCDRLFTTKSEFSNHAQHVHKMLVPEFNENSLIYCSLCDWTCSSIAIYRHHLEDMHRIQVPTHRDPVLQSLAMNLGNHCNQCKLTYHTRSSFLHHLDDIHEFRKTSSIIEQGLKAKAIDSEQVNSKGDRCTCDYCSIEYQEAMLLKSHDIDTLQSYKHCDNVHDTRRAHEAHLHDAHQEVGSMSLLFKYQIEPNVTDSCNY